MHDPTTPHPVGTAVLDHVERDDGAHAIAMPPSRGSYHDPVSDVSVDGGILYQRHGCGGGRRVIRKKIGGE